MQVHPKTSRVFRQHCLQRRWPIPHLRCAMRDGRLALVDRDAFEVEWWIELSQNERQVQGTMRKCHMELNLREFADLDCIRYLKQPWPVRINEDQWKAVRVFAFINLAWTSKDCKYDPSSNPWMAIPWAEHSTSSHMPHVPKTSQALPRTLDFEMKIHIS